MEMMCIEEAGVYFKYEDRCCALKLADIIKFGLH